MSEHTQIRGDLVNLDLRAQKDVAPSEAGAILTVLCWVALGGFAERDENLVAAGFSSFVGLP